MWVQEANKTLSLYALKVIYLIYSNDIHSVKIHWKSMFKGFRDNEKILAPQTHTKYR
jgi:hypothetical protein